MKTSRKPSKFFNREISWVDFNERVLHEALDSRTPTLERLKFIAIFSSNLDEFFMKRIGGLKRQLSAGITKRSPDGLTPHDQLDILRERTIDQVCRQRECLLNDILPSLEKHGVKILRFDQLTSQQKRKVNHEYKKSIFPILIPLGVGPGQPFPFISNMSLSIAVRLRPPGSQEVGFARVKIPTNRPRWLPTGVPNVFVPIEEVIAANLAGLFPGVKIIEQCSFRVTRSVDIDRKEDEADDLLELIEEELMHREFAQAVRLELDRSCSPAMQRILTEHMKLQPDDVYVVDGPLSLRDLMALGKLDYPELKDPAWKGPTHPAILRNDLSDEPRSFFSLIRERDIMVHHPYESFNTSVLRFLEEASNDKRVLAIKQTLYRTADDSPIIKALKRAAANGKQVAVLIEIKARFDEAANIQWVRTLEDAGVHVTYGFVGLKTHTKTLLVVREEADCMRRYVHIGTGNYHPGTANLYTDYSLLSCRDELGEDISDLFNTLTGYSRQTEYRKLLIAPANMRKKFERMIQREMNHAKKGKPARIIAKMNSLEDIQMIEWMYKASKAGVKIDLLVRGICCLKPGVEGLSENIRVISVIGRFLEHSRVFYFQNGGKEEVYIGSADWMRRNLDFRYEAIAPIEDAELKKELLDTLELFWKDNRKCWDLHPDGTYTQRTPGNEKELCTHTILMERVLANSKLS
ncbi:MAG: polyphosphate kinase 1 [Candidatus Hinthialibacter antarcticus]|nr:polyphosphate kinase 1 [Candidatus Hinthialibacter antarcticus]